MTTNPITATAKQSFTRIDELDGLRGILALWVALVHIISWCGLTPHEFINLPVVAKRLWDESAQGAVDVFIILSGFVITYLLNSRPQTYRQFMIGRFFRIYPVYLICLLLGWLTIGSVSFILNHAPWHGITSFQDWASPAATAQSAHPVAHLLTHMTLLFGIIPKKSCPALPLPCSDRLGASLWNGSIICWLRSWPGGFFPALAYCCWDWLARADLFLPISGAVPFYRSNFLCSWWALAAITSMQMPHVGECRLNSSPCLWS